MTDDILHTGRADIHHPKGPLTAVPAAQQPLSRDEQWEAEKVVTSLPGLGYDWTTIDDYNAAQAWAVEAYLAAAARAQAEYDEATQELAGELADERTLHQQTIRELETMREVARGNKRHVKYLTEECERLTAEVARVRADERQRVAELVQVLFAVYKTWWYDVGTTEPPRDLIDQGVASLLSLEDDQAMEAACLAVEQHLPAIQSLLVPAERVQDGSTDTTGTPDPQRFWWHHDGPGPTDNSGLVCAPTPGTADKPRSSGCVGCGCMTTVKWQRGEPITDMHPEPQEGS